MGKGRRRLQGPQPRPPQLGPRRKPGKRARPQPGRAAPPEQQRGGEEGEDPSASPAASSEGGDADSGGEEGTQAPHGYRPGQRILLVGEGDFTYARALLRLFGGRGQNIVASALDSRPEVLRKYQEEGAAAVEATLAELERGGVRLKFEIDACRLAETLKARKKQGGLKPHELSFDRVVFNFPHVGRGIENEAVNIRKNRELLAAFFRAACEVLRPHGEIHVALRRGKPYSEWNVRGTAWHASDKMLDLKTERPMEAHLYPGYAHQRTRGRWGGEGAGAAQAAFVLDAVTHVFGFNQRRLQAALAAAAPG